MSQFTSGMAFLTNNRILGFTILDILLLGVIVSMPLDNLINSYLICIWSIAAILSNPIKEKVKRLNSEKIWILPVLYFCWIALSLLWDQSSNKNTSILEHSASFVVFPLILGSVNKIEKKVINRILILFSISVIICCIFCLYKSYLDYKKNNYVNVFFYHHLSMQLSLNAIYLSLYVVMSIIILLNNLLFYKSNAIQKILFIIFIIFLLVVDVLLASKMLLFLLFISLLSICIYSVFHFKKMRFIYLFLALCIITIPILLLNVPYVRARLNETEFLGYRSSADNLNGIAVRSLLWKSAWKLIKEKPILGYGHYSAQDRLREEYAKKGFEEGVKDDYNSHNQYLYSWLNYGIIGVMLITGYIFIFIKIAIRRKNLLMILFGLIFSIANITECMLQVQKGIVYFMLFSTLFLYHYFESGKLKISNNIYGEP